MQRSGLGFWSLVNPPVASQATRTTRQRDVFPLPMPDWSCGLLHADLLQVSIQARWPLRQQVEGTIRSLNELYAEGVLPGGTAPNAVQRASQRAILKQVAQGFSVGPMYNFQEAAGLLLKSSLSYAKEQVSSTVRSFQEELVAIPTCGHSAPQLDSILDGGGRELLNDFKTTLLHYSQTWSHILETEPPIMPYMDVRLRSDLLLYEKFVERLHDAGMIAFTDRPLDLVTPLFVEKKGGRLRLVWDCRSCNRRFRASDPMSMPSGTTWAAIELQKHEKLYTAQSDVKDFFYSPLVLMSNLDVISVCRRSGLNVPENVIPMLKVVVQCPGLF